MTGTSFHYRLRNPTFGTLCRRFHRQAGKHFNSHVYNDIKTIAEHVHQNYAGRPHEGGKAISGWTVR